MLLDLSSSFQDQPDCFSYCKMCLQQMMQDLLSKIRTSDFLTMNLKYFLVLKLTQVSKIATVILHSTPNIYWLMTDWGNNYVWQSDTLHPLWVKHLTNALHLWRQRTLSNRKTQSPFKRKSLKSQYSVAKYSVCC